MYLLLFQSVDTFLNESGRWPRLGGESCHVRSGALSWAFFDVLIWVCRSLLTIIQ